MRRALVLLALVALPGCGAAERLTGSTPATETDRVEVVLRPDGAKGQAVRKTLACTSVTPDCRRLRDADFTPPKGKACAQVYGGPATATVTGKAGGRAVDAGFSLTDSCAIDRWRRFAWLLGPPPGA